QLPPGLPAARPRQYEGTRVDHHLALFERRATRPDTRRIDLVDRIDGNYASAHDGRLCRRVTTAALGADSNGTTVAACTRRLVIGQHPDIRKRASAGQQVQAVGKVQATWAATVFKRRIACEEHATTLDAGSCDEAFTHRLEIGIVISACV